eukprot:3507754-Pleurochrysis_carterae.AAC.1
MAARISSRLPPGHRRRPCTLPTFMPSAVTGSPTATFAGAARRPSSASPSTASCACTCARVCGGAGVPLSASVCLGSIVMWATHAGG